MIINRPKAQSPLYKECNKSKEKCVVQTFSSVRNPTFLAVRLLLLIFQDQSWRFSGEEIKTYPLQDRARPALWLHWPYINHAAITRCSGPEKVRHTAACQYGKGQIGLDGKNAQMYMKRDLMVHVVGTNLCRQFTPVHTSSHQFTPVHTSSHQFTPVFKIWYYLKI